MVLFYGGSELRLGGQPTWLAKKVAWNKAPGNCVLIQSMKKLLFLGWIFLTACQPATVPPTSTLPPTATVPPSQTPIPPTETPEPTATVALTPTPLPRLFTNEFDAPLDGWTILQAGNNAVPDLQTENSSLVFQMDTPFTWGYAVYEPQEYDNIRIDARVTNLAGSPASMGLVCHYDESQGWLEYNLSTDGTYNVLYGQWLAEGVAHYLPVLSASSAAIQPSGTAQEMGVICSAGMLYLFIDQTLIRTVDASRFALTGGSVGITASSFENTPVIAAFDWVRVSEP